MKNKKRFTAFALGLAGGFLALAQAQASTTYSPGDLFIGFRQTSASNTLAANIGQASQFFPPSLGGSATTPFNVQFGLIPNTVTPVFDLNADLTDTFGGTWANNPGGNTGVRWGVVGFTDNSFNNTPTSGLTFRSIYVTKPRTNPAVKTTTPSAGSYDNDSFSGEFNAFATVSTPTAYPNQTSTANSTVAYVGAKSGADNWNTRIGANGSFSLGGTQRVEQPTTGSFNGPTNSALDFYLFPNTGSTLATSPTYLGYFQLNSSGQLNFTPVPEPSTFALLAIGGTALIAFRRRNRSQILAS